MTETEAKTLRERVARAMEECPNPCGYDVLADAAIAICRAEFARVAERYAPTLETSADIVPSLLVEDIAEAIRNHEVEK